MSLDYYFQSRGPAKHPSNTVNIDDVLLGTFFISLLIPIVLHFLDTIYIFIRIISLTVFWRATTTLKVFGGLWEIFSKIHQLQPVQHEYIANSNNLMKLQKNQTAPPSEDFLYQATQHKQLASTAKQLQQIEYCQCHVLKNFRV